MKALLGKRDLDTHKGNYGRVGIIGGSTGYTGAPYLSSMAALRAGSGYVFALVPQGIQAIMSIKLTEAIIRPVYDNKTSSFTMESLQDVLKYIKEMDALAIGPGMGIDADRIYLVKEIIKNARVPLVLDADAINCISSNPKMLKNHKSTIIATPHPGEMAKLLDISIEKLQEKRVYYSELIAKKYNMTIVLKGHKTVVASPIHGIYINDTGNPGMATAGSGDILTGMIASFLGQGIKPFEAAKLGVHIHGMAGDLANEKLGEYGMIATDIMENIPYAIREYNSKK